MARTMRVPCRRDLACYRDDGHAGDHAYVTPDTVPSPAPIWQAGYDAGYREAQEDIAASAALRAAPPSDPAAPLDVERLARAMSKVAYPDPEDAWPNTVKDVKDLYRYQAAAVAREYAALATPAPEEADRE